MSVDSAFKTELVKDATIADITNDLTYAVVSGASSTTYQQFTPSSNSNSSLTWSVQLPSENIVMGRDALLSTSMVITVSCGSATNVQYQVPVGQPAFQYGVDSAFAPFPFSQLISTASAQINNTAVSVNLQDVLPQLLAMNDREFLTAWNATTPSLPDGDFGSYADGLGTNNNPLAGYGNGGYDNQVLPRGAYPVSMVVVHNITGGGIDTSLISTNVADTWTITLTINVVEPIFLSPFMWSDAKRNAQGLVGINNFSLTLNMTPPTNVYQSVGSPFNGVPQTRCFCSASPYISGISAGSVAGGSMFSSPQLLLRFLSTQPSDLIESKNVVPFTDIPRYITPSSNAGSFDAGDSKDITTQNIQINQIPSKFIIVVRNPYSSSTIQQPSTFLTINSISVNLNNASGLLSSCTKYDLWKLSRKSGSNQSWLQFKGLANKVGNDYVAGYGLDAIATGGSMLVLDPAIDLSLPETLSNGSLGSYNFQLRLNVSNQYDYAISPEVVIMCVNDGILVNNQGTSTTYTGILTRQMVMDAKEMKAIPMTEEVRMVGGRFHDMGLVRHSSKRHHMHHMHHMHHKAHSHEHAHAPMKSFSHLLKK